ncbi:hypothetical protein D3C71_1478420 [compost metagenome]
MGDSLQALHLAFYLCPQDTEPEHEFFISQTIIGKFRRHEVNHHRTVYAGQVYGNAPVRGRIFAGVASYTFHSTAHAVGPFVHWHMGGTKRFDRFRYADERYPFD